MDEEISIHALREEGDYRSASAQNFSKIFLSTPSARRATSLTSVLWGCSKISIHALREEGDANSQPLSQVMDLFLSTPSARRAT